MFTKIEKFFILFSVPPPGGSAPFDHALTDEDCEREEEEIREKLKLVGKKLKENMSIEGKK